MKTLIAILISLSISTTLGCQPDTPQTKNISTQAHTADGFAAFGDQAHVTQLVKESGIADNKRSLVHVSHTCTLTINGDSYAAVDMRELVKGATTARGVNQIILLNAENQLISRIEYGNARPLFCEDNKLYLHGEIIPEGQVEEGNVLVFTDSGFSVSVIKEDLNTKLPLR